MSDQAPAGSAVPVAGRPDAQRQARELPPLAVRPVIALAGSLGVFLLMTAQQWGYHGDELYFLAAGEHLNISYADQPPLLPLLARLANTAFPGSLLGLRLPAIVLTTAGAVVTALGTRELGGRGWAQTIATATYAVSPQMAVNGRLLLTPTVNTFLLAVLTLLLTRWVRCRDDRTLVGIGLIVAVALETKYLVALFCLACLGSALVVGPRDLLRRPLLWSTAGLVTVTTLPGLSWQYEHGWPQLELVEVIPREVAEVGGRMAFLPLTALDAGVVAGAALAVYGLVRLLLAPHLHAYRFLGYACASMTVVFLAAGGRYYYCAEFFPLCWAVAAVELQRFPPTGWWRWLVAWPSYLFSAVLVLTLSAVAPLPWARNTVNYLGNETGGWHQLTGTVAAAYRKLPPKLRSTTVVLTVHYWQASALDRFGPRWGLPRPYSPSRGYWYFGRPPDTPGAVLFVGPHPGMLRQSCQPVASVTGHDGLAGITDKVPVWLCVGPHPPWSTLWTALRQP